MKSPVQALLYSLGILLIGIDADATERKKISLSASRNGTIALEITSTVPLSEELSIPRDYSVQYSTDLKHWVELTRVSSLESFSEVRDQDAKSSSMRFYRIEPIELNETDRIQVASFVQELESHNQFLSGILLKGTSLADILALRENESELRAKLQELIDNNEQIPDGLVKLYQEVLADTDAILSSNPLEIEIGSTILEIEVSEAMRRISEEYQRLGLVSLNDFDRLPGITPNDLEGLETLAEHLNRRQVGRETTIPIFDTLSPFGTFTLVDRLVRNFGEILLEKTSDLDHDRKLEINYELFRRLINGVELTTRETAAIIEELTNANPIPWNTITEPPVLTANLKGVLSEIDVVEQVLETETEALLNGKEYDPVFVNLIRERIKHQLRAIHSGFIQKLESHIKRPSTTLEFLPVTSLTRLSAPPSAAELIQFVSILSQWNESIQVSVTDLLESLEISENLASSFKSVISDKLNGYWTPYQFVPGLYTKQFEIVERALELESILFELTDGHSTQINVSQFPVLTSLPFNVSELLKYPGIAANVSEEELSEFHSGEDWRNLMRVSLSPISESNPDILSIFGRNVELLALLLERFGAGVIINGSFDSTAFTRLILIDQDLSAVVNAIDQTLSAANGSIDDLDIDLQIGLSNNEYRAILGVLEATRNSIRDSANETIAQLEQPIKATFESVLQTSYNSLNQKVDDLLAVSFDSHLKIVINDKVHSIRTRPAIDFLRAQLNRIAVIEDNNSPTRRQYLRLNGVSEALATGLKPSSYRTRLRYLWNAPGESVGAESSETDSLDIQTDILDITFNLIPAVMEAFGQDILDGENSVDLARFKQILLQGVYAPVADGETIRSRHIQLASSEISEGESKLRPLNMSTWEDRLSAETIYQSMKEQIIESMGPLIQELTTEEIRILEQDFSRLNSVRDLYARYIDLDNPFPISNLLLTLPDGRKFSIPLQSIKSIPNFPFSLDYWDRKLFVGIEESDMESSKQLSRSIRYSRSGVFDEETRFQGISRDKLIVNLLLRFYANNTSNFKSIKSDLFKDGTISVEVFRRIIKGVDALHRETLINARQVTDDTIARMQFLTHSAMTMDNALAVYRETADLQHSIIEYLTNLTDRHEREDVIEIEEAITAIYKNVVDEMIDYYRSNELVIDASGTPIAVPVHQIADALIDIIETRFPGEEIGTHHFSAIAGISVEDLREYNKLEDFLGAQIIALPRNSQYVEILSKLSEVGFMQLAHGAIKRHFNSVVDVSNNKIDLDTLLTLLTDDGLAFQRVEAVIQSIHDDATNRLNAIQKPNTPYGLREALSITTELKSAMASRVNDHISDFTLEQITSLQTRIDTLFADFVSSRDSLLMGQLISIETIDHQFYRVNLSEIENAVVNRLEELVLENPPQDVPVMTPAFDLSPLISRTGERSLPPQDFEPEHTLTRLGLHILTARLIEKYGITVGNNDVFSLDKFLEELGQPQSERAEELIENLTIQVLAKLEALVPAGNGAIAHQDILVINEFLVGERRRFSEALGSPDYSNENPYEIQNYANESWRSVIERYENLLFNRNITIRIDGHTVTIPTASLVERMNQAYREGHTDLLDSLLEGGEPDWVYENFKFIPSYYDRFPFSSPTMGTAKNGNEFSIENPLFPFSLGELLNVPGISLRDLSSLETEQTQWIKIERIPASELVKARFNLRILSPGFSPQTIGARQLGFTNALEGDFTDMVSWPPANRYLELSQRDIRFRLLKEIIEIYADILIDFNGLINLDAFEILLRAPLETEAIGAE